MKYPREVHRELSKLKLKKFIGSGNKCPDCKKKGYFGSISQVSIGNKIYLICGWCGSVTPSETK